MTKTVQLSPAELDGVVTTDEHWDASLILCTTWKEKLQSQRKKLLD